jgi:putative transposase
MGDKSMPKKYYKAEQLINILRQIEILRSQGQTAQVVARGVGISEQTYYRCRKEYGGMCTDQAQRLKDLEQENSRLKRIVADLGLEKGWPACGAGSLLSRSSRTDVLYRTYGDKVSFVSYMWL